MRRGKAHKTNHFGMRRETFSSIQGSHTQGSIRRSVSSRSMYTGLVTVYVRFVVRLHPWCHWPKAVQVLNYSYVCGLPIQPANPRLTCSS